MGDSWSGHRVAVGHSSLLDHVVDVGVVLNGLEDGGNRSPVDRPRRP